jgi:hypothetical protein
MSYDQTTPELIKKESIYNTNTGDIGKNQSGYSGQDLSEIFSNTGTQGSTGMTKETKTTIGLGSFSNASINPKEITKDYK